MFVKAVSIRLICHANFLPSYRKQPSSSAQLRLTNCSGLRVPQCSGNQWIAWHSKGLHKVDKVKKHKSKNSSYKLTAFAVVSGDEFISEYSGSGDISLVHEDVPDLGETFEGPFGDSVDWVQKGAVNLITN